MELAVNDKVEEELKERLLELRKGAYWSDICTTNPDKWLRVAVSVYRGEAIRKVTKEHKVSQQMYYKIRKQILDIRNKYVEYQIDAIDAHIDAADEATTGMLEVLHKSIEDMKDDLNYDTAKAAESVSSSLDKVQKSAVSMAMRKNKLLDKPDVVVENRGPQIDYEARKQELLAMRKAEAVDLIEE